MPLPEPRHPSLLHEFFWRAVQRWPNECALDVPPSGAQPRTVLSYRALANLAAAVAERVAPHAGPDAVVALCLSRAGPELYAAQLGVLSAGAAYVGLESSHPDAHLATLLDEAAARAVLSDAAGCRRLRVLRPDLPAYDVGALLAAAVAVPAPAALPLPNARGATAILPEHLAYLVFTSGTTGRPKAVAIEHRTIANLVAHDLLEFGLGPGDRVAQGSSPAYDSSVEEVWLALAAGATVVPLDHDVARLGPDLPAWLRRERITVLCPPPTQLRAMACREPWRELPALRLVYAGGEALPQDLADAFARGRRCVNGYGPTECTVTVLRAEVRPGVPVAIGHPVPGAVAHVLDEALEPVADGERGELCIGGAVLARGYLGAPEATAAKFVTHAQFGRIYRTGDAVHRGVDGALYYHGRLDAQVKVRGHRVELAEIEAQINGLPGVRQAACVLQGDQLVACVVPARPDAALATPALAAALRGLLPPHCVPERWWVVDALPTSVGGKLDRRAVLAGLPAIAAAAGPTAGSTGEPTAAAQLAGAAPVPANDPELALLATITAAVGAELGTKAGPDDDFFALGGNSLRAAALVSRLRAQPATAAITVRAVYEQRTARALAQCAAAGSGVAEPRQRELATVAARPRPRLVACLQAAWLAAELVGALWLLAVWPWQACAAALSPFGWSAWVVVPVAAWLARLAWTLPALAAVRLGSWLLVGRAQPGAVPVHSLPYLRHWCVERLARWVPWDLLQGTELQNAALRWLGARIGRGVHFARGVELRRGAWALLEVGDGAVVGRDAALGLVELRDGLLVHAPVQLGPRAVLEVRSGLQGGSSLGAGARLRPHAMPTRGVAVPAGEVWDGVPAARTLAEADAPPALAGGVSAALPALAHTLLVLALRAASAAGAGLAVLALVALLAATTGRTALFGAVLGEFEGAVPVGALALALLGWVPLRVLGAACWLRWSPRVAAGWHAVRSVAHVLFEHRSHELEAAGVWLSGTLFWPWFLRLAGARIGRAAEISTITGTLPEHLTLGGTCFLADGIYLGEPVLRAGALRIAPVQLGERTFLGNHVVVPAGTKLPSDLLLGVCTVADGTRMLAGSAWFGLPPFPLPQREVVAVDPRLTVAPGWLQRANRAVWELLRGALPFGAAALLGCWWQVAGAPEASVGWLGRAVLASVSTGAAAVLCVCAAKWLLLGRVRAGQHGLWSCWCSRWDFLYVLWGFLARPVLEPFGGTPWLAWCLRAMGMRLGRGVVLGPGFAHVVDPDMLEFGDGATVDTMFQAHTFEDRVLKIAPVRVGAHATLGHASVVLYGASIEAGAEVTPHSVVMKLEVLPAGGRYTGAPVQPMATQG
jgi:non-ribosomal peptide synthetase-like protein